MADVIRLKAPGGADQLEAVTIELPPPQADEIRIRQTAIGVNFIDVYQRMGLYPLPPAAIPGVEAVGVVTAVGANVTSPRIGDRIAYAGAPVGAYVSERNLPAWRAVVLPKSIADGRRIGICQRHHRAHAVDAGLSCRPGNNRIDPQRRRRARSIDDTMGEAPRGDRDRNRRFRCQGRDGA
jgi:hypothetical protein